MDHFINMSRKNALFLLLFFIAILGGLLHSCASDDADPVPDISDIEVDLEIKRFEQDLFGLDTSRVGEGLKELEARYPEFSRVFFGQVLAAYDRRVAPEGPEAYVRGFLQHPAVRRLYDTTLVVYPDLKDIGEQYRTAFRFYKHYFPKRRVPDVTTFISEYTVAAFIYDSTSLAVGLDFFLGSDYPYQKYNPGNSNFSAYLTRSFNREHLVAKSLQPLAEDITGPPAGERLLDIMVNKGKQLYILDRLLPFAPDSVILEVSDKQARWLADNELEMWAYFLQENLLYSTKWQDIRKYVEYSPNSPGMPPDAPGRTANYLGWRIVREYMRHHPDATMDDLVAMRDAQMLLDESRYKPLRE